MLGRRLGAPSISSTTSRIHNPTPITQVRLWVYQTHNILPEGNACSRFSPACVLLGTYLCQSSPATNHRSMLQSRSGCSCHRGHRVAECRDVLPYRGDFWNYTSTRQRYLRSVSLSGISDTHYLTRFQMPDRVPTYLLRRFVDLRSVSLQLSNAPGGSTREISF